MRTFLLVVASLMCGACAGDTTAAPSTAKTYTGSYSAQVVESTVSTSLTGGGTFPCTNTYTMSGTLTMTIDEAAGATLGSAQITGTQVETAHSSAASCVAKGNETHWSPKLTGAIADLHFDDQNVSTNAGYAVTSKTSFTGGLSGGVVTGVLGFSVAGSGTIGGVTSIVQTYSSTMSVTLR